MSFATADELVRRPSRVCTASHASSAVGIASVGSITARRMRLTVGSFIVVAISSSTTGSTAPKSRSTSMRS